MGGRRQGALRSGWGWLGQQCPSRAHGRCSQPACVASAVLPPAAAADNAPSAPLPSPLQRVFKFSQEKWPRDEEYEFHVTAHNKVGHSSASEDSPLETP